MLKTYTGSCHCGAVRFEADIDLSQPTYRCNCSICRRTRFWPAIVTPDRFRLLAGDGELTEYRFNSLRNSHHFCRTCGVRPFGIGNNVPGGERISEAIALLDALSRADELADFLTLPAYDRID